VVPITWGMYNHRVFFQYIEGKAPTNTPEK